MTVLATDSRDEEGLEVRFEWTGDRFGHTICALRGREQFPLVAAIGGDAKSAWPASPPFQQVTIETRQTGRVALLVGMAGNSHWSGSIECRRGEPRLSFDIACLVKEAPIRLGSSYRIEAESFELRDSIMLHFPAGRARLASLGSGCIRPCSDVPEVSVTIGVAVSQSDFKPQTVRWQYELELVP